MNQKLNHEKISIAGDLGSGKSLIGKLLGKKTGFKFYSTGGIQREIASRHGITTLELNKLSEESFEIDEEIDTFTRKLSESSESFIIDSRMAWYFIPNSFKIYLQVNVDIAAKRIFYDKSRKNENYPNFDSAKNDIIRRKKSEVYRFRKYYQVDCDNMDHFDLVIDTSYSTPDEIIETILNNLSSSIAPDYKHKYWFPPKSLFPTKNPLQLQQEPAKHLVNVVKTNGYDHRFSIDVVSKDEYFYIYDGHKRASAALFNQVSLIPVNIMAANEEEISPGLSVREFINKRCKFVWLQDWEGCHQFRFLSYPGPPGRGQCC